MKIIPLTQGQVALVDNEDFEVLNKFKWHVRKGQRTLYAVRLVHNPSPSGPRQKVLRMHRIILGLTNPKTEGEHRDGNGLNNRRNNLRVATRAQNCRAFQTNRHGKTSKFRGVSWNRPNKKWSAQIKANRKITYLGLFKDEREAARAYDSEATRLFGEFAAPNFKN